MGEGLADLGVLCRAELDRAGKIFRGKTFVSHTFKKLHVANVSGALCNIQITIRALRIASTS